VSETEGANTRGWGWPMNSQKAHYFPAGEIISLCGRWMYSGHLEDDRHESRDNCAACRKKRERRAGAGGGE